MLVRRKQSVESHPIMKEKSDKQSDSRVLRNAATGVTIRIVQSGSETEGRLLELEATYPPHSSEPPQHFHPRQDEEFVILAGSMMAHVAGETSRLHPSDVLLIPAGTSHSMWNAGDEPSHVAHNASARDRSVLSRRLLARRRASHQRPGHACPAGSGVARSTVLGRVSDKLGHLRHFRGSYFLYFNH